MSLHDAKIPSNVSNFHQFSCHCVCALFVCMLICPFPHCCPCHFSIRCTFKVFHYLLTSSYPLLNALRNRLWRLQVLTLSCESSLSFPFPVLLFFWHGTLPYSAWLFHTLMACADWCTSLSNAIPHSQPSSLHCPVLLSSFTFSQHFQIEHHLSTMWCFL